MYPIPANATRIRYLESTGTQYVDTGVVPNPQTEIRLQATVTQTAGRGLVYTYPQNENSELRLFFSLDGSGFYYDRGSARLYYGTTARNLDLVATNYALYLSGTQVKSGGVQSWTGTTSLRVFGNIVNGGKYDLMRLRVLQILDGTTLVRDYVPVRIGQTGYLFDRASGQLFGNAGTGDFVLGPDTFQQGVIPTRMMPMGVRRPLPTTWDYVQDGLVAMWDGIENAGRGIHDAAATEWKDLVGDRTLSARVSGFAWGDSYGAFNGTGIRANINLGPIAAMEAVLVFPAARLNQIVVRGTGNWTRDYKLYIGSDSYDIAAGVNGEYNLWGGRKSDGVTPHSCHYQFPGTTDKFYLDGSLVGSRSSSKYATATSVLTLFQSGAANVGRVYCVRLYNRALSDAEVAANYAIDKARFKLP